MGRHPLKILLFPALLALAALPLLGGCGAKEEGDAKSEAQLRKDLTSPPDASKLPPDVQEKMKALRQGGKK